MATLHPDSAAIDRIGGPIIREHFGLTRGAIFYWRRNGVPDAYRREMISLGKRHKVEMPEMKVRNGRRPGRPPTSGNQPTSPATPA